MNKSKMKCLTNWNPDWKIVKETCVSLVRMHFSQFAAISCLMIICYMGINQNMVWGQIMKNNQVWYVIAMILKTLDLLNTVWDNLAFNQNMK